MVKNALFSSTLTVIIKNCVILHAENRFYYAVMTKYIIRLAPWFLALAAIALALLCCEDHLLWKLQEHNLFLASSIFFHEQMLVALGHGMDMGDMGDDMKAFGYPTCMVYKDQLVL